MRYIATGTLWKMDEMFQLSIELYDTKVSQIIWSDIWQEHWDNLAIIKKYLSDGLLKVLDTKTNIDSIIEINNSEAYEHFLRGNYQYVHVLVTYEVLCKKNPPWPSKGVHFRLGCSTRGKVNQELPRLF